MVGARRKSVFSGVRGWAAGWLLLLLFTATVSWLLPASWLKLDSDLLHISEPPSARHWLGTDPFGRDVVTDLVRGAQSLISLSLPAAVLTSLLGAGLGGAAGYWGNHRLQVSRAGLLLGLVCVVGGLLTGPALLVWWLGGAVIIGFALNATIKHPSTIALPLDDSILSVAAFLGAVPRLLLVLIFVALRPASTEWLLLLLTLTCWPSTARLVRAQVQYWRQQQFVEAAHALGGNDARVLLRHILPNAWPTIRAALPLTLSTCIGLQTTLAFLGLGLPPDRSDWGRTLANARLEPSAWWLILGAVVPLAATLVALRAFLPSNNLENEVR